MYIDEVISNVYKNISLSVAYRHSYETQKVGVLYS